jgi:restriction system protein
LAPRKKKQDSLDLLILAFSRMPWWAALAIPVAVLAISLALHLILPWVWTLIAAVAAALGQLERTRHRQLITGTTTLEHLRALSWKDFETLVEAAYRRDGYQVEATSSGADGGVDVVLRRDGETTYVQCKHWRQRQVGVRPVRELRGCMAADGVPRGILICTGAFSPDAVAATADGPIKLVDGMGVLRLLGREPGAVTGPAPMTAVAVPCPKCGADMVRRQPRRRQSAGSEFLGCSRFPACRGVLNL